VRPLLIAVLLCACTRAAGPARLRIDDPDGHWTRAGFVEMVPPIRPPSSGDGGDRIVVYLRLPERGGIEVTVSPHGPTLRFPPGTDADRVELDGSGAVIDVRGTRFEADGREVFHVYRPGVGGALIGTEWRRDDSAGAAEALAFLDAELRSGSRLDGPALDRFVRRFEALNDCVACHAHGQPEASFDRPGRPNRRTDASGLYVPLETLGDAAPVERHRPRDMNADDPYIHTTCGDAPAELTTGRAGSRRYDCPGGRVAISRLDLAAARAAGDAHAQAVCAGRAYLFAHLDAAGRRAFAAGLADCGLTK
jgi:hypothetical protein